MFDNGNRYILVISGSMVRAMSSLERLTERLGTRAVADSLYRSSAGDTIVHMRTDAWHESVVRALNDEMLCRSADITWWHYRGPNYQG
jgi:hypothetical protein